MLELPMDFEDGIFIAHWTSVYEEEEEEEGEDEDEGHVVAGALFPSCRSWAEAPVALMPTMRKPIATIAAAFTLRALVLIIGCRSSATVWALGEPFPDNTRVV
ncbi:hypothetical protein [Demequina lutea]|uniref:Uncharacterized protein n=1 Tax=Demequina lutea TaxID=431489 RepID=A0A7Y9Z9R3_9MICO|nr:hypothetical protein [Demequina lutea]NYI40268.1 hypothetical protein [Demequina lutea]